MTNSDRWATVLYILALLILIGVGGMEYMQYGERTKVEQLAQQEATAKTKEESLRKRAEAAEKEKVVIAALEANLLKLANGNYYRQILLEGVGNERDSGAKVPTFTFAEGAAVGKFPRYTLTVSASGSDEQVFDFVSRFEQGPHKVQVGGITYTTAAGATAVVAPPATTGNTPAAGAPKVPTGGPQASAQVQLLFTAEKPMLETKPAANQTPAANTQAQPGTTNP